MISPRWTRLRLALMGMHAVESARTLPSAELSRQLYVGISKSLMFVRVKRLQRVRVAVLEVGPQVVSLIGGLVRPSRNFRASSTSVFPHLEPSPPTAALSTR